MSFNKPDLITAIMACIETDVLGELTAEQKADSLPKMELLVKAIVEPFVDHIVANGEISVSEAPGGTPLSPPGIGTIS